MKGKNSQRVSKRLRDNSATCDGGQVGTAVDCSNQRKKPKKADKVTDQKDAKKVGLKVTFATTSANPSSSSSSTSSVAIAGASRGTKLSAVAPSQNSVKNPTASEIEMMQHIQSVMDELKSVPDITKMIQDSETITMPVDCSSASAPVMVSEGIGGKFQTVNFYWLDMFEEPEHPGVLFIFGKVKSPSPGNGYSSGCILVKNLNRRVFVLPRRTKADGTPVDYMDVYNEFYTIVAPQLKLPAFKCQRSKRRFCFDIEGIPLEAEYMEVRYLGTVPALQEDVNGETFSHVFGTNTSLMETFLLEKNLKGPCWLQLSYCERVQPDQQQSWSKFEFTCDVSSVKVHPESSNFPTPTLVLASLKTECVYNPNLKRPAFIFVGVAVHESFNLRRPLPPNEIFHDFFCVINTPPGQTWPVGLEHITNKRIVNMDSELSMLECFVNKLHEIDADMCLDYGICLSLLLNQLSDLKVPNWSRIGRLKRSTPLPVTEDKIPSSIRIPGRLFSDMVTSGLMPMTQSLTGLREEWNDRVAPARLAHSEMKALYESCKDLQSFIKWEMKHCVLNIRDMNEFKVLPLAFQMSCIVGDTLARMLIGNESYPMKYLLLHALSASDYIVPDNCKFLNLKKAAADNQFVLEPGSGNAFYENYVLQLKFESEWLYPFSLQEYQIFLSNGPDAGTEEPTRSVLNELWKLSKSQEQVKFLMDAKDLPADQMREYEVRLKGLETATWEVMFEAVQDWPFRDPLQAFMKAQVRDMLLKLREIVSKMGYEVIYGSENYVMIQTHSLDMTTAFEIEKKLKEEIQRIYPLLPDCYSVSIYRSLLLLKDNKYAGLRHNQVDFGDFFKDPFREMSSIVSKTARACLLEILSEQPLCDKIYKVGKVLWDVGRRLRDGALPFEELLITKTLTKDPEEYEKTHGLHQVTVALRMTKRKTQKKKFRKGDQVSYVFCTDGRPRHLSEMKSKKGEDTNLKADPDYYLSQMIHPVVTEICEQIPGLGLDSARVADALGLGAGSSSVY